MRYHYIDENNEEQLNTDYDFLCDYCKDKKPFDDIEYIKSKDNNCIVFTELEINVKNVFMKK